jgi:hypothetical protein
MTFVYQGQKCIFFVRVRVFWLRRSRGFKTSEDERPFLAEVHIKFLERTNYIQSKIHHWKNYEFILSNFFKLKNLLIHINNLFIAFFISLPTEREI